jgi:hypothetical protein
MLKNVDFSDAETNIFEKKIASISGSPQASRRHASGT